MSHWAGLRCFVLGCAVTLVMAGGARADASVSLTDLRIGQHKAFTRLVLEIDAALPYSIKAPDGGTVHLTLAKPLGPSAANRQRRGGLVKALSFDTKDHKTHLAIKGTKPLRLRRHFTIPAANGKNHRIVLDLEAGPSKVVKAIAQQSKSRPHVQLPPMYTTIVVDQPKAAVPKKVTKIITDKTAPRRQANTENPRPALRAKAAATAATPIRKPKRPVEIASIGGMQMLYVGDDSDPEAPELADAATVQDDAPTAVQLAQSGISMRDWLDQQRGNPNVPNAAPPAYRPPAPPAPPPPTYGQGYSRPSAYRAPTYSGPAYQGPAYRAPAHQTPVSGGLPEPTSASDQSRSIRPYREPGFSRNIKTEPEGGITSTDDQTHDFYVGAGTGYTAYNATPSSFRTISQDSDFNFKLVGGIRLNRFLAFELQFVQLGELEQKVISTGDSLEETFRTVTFGSTLQMWNDGILRPYVKGGGHLWWTKPKGTGNLADTGAEADVNGFVGIGMDYEFSENVLLRGEFEHFFIRDRVDASVMTANFIFEF